MLDALLGEALAQIVERARVLALVVRPAILVPDLEVIHHADDHHVLGERAALAVVLRTATTPASFGLVLGESALVGIVYVAVFCGVGLRPADRARYASSVWHAAVGPTPRVAAL